MRHYSISLESPDLPINAFRKAFGKNRPQTLEGIGGGKGGGSAPSAPDPYYVAGAATQANKDIGGYNKALNLNNYNNPFGGQNSFISGYDDKTGAPIYQTDISANPALQAQLSSLLGQTARSDSINQSAIGGLYGLNAKAAGIGNQYSDLNSQLAGLQGYLNPQAAQQAQQQGQDAAYASQAQYLDPQFNQRQESLQAQLAAQGLAPGSQAYTNASTNFNNERQQAYSNAQNQAILTGSQIGTQNWQNQLGGLSANAGLLGQQASNLGQQSNALGQQSALIGQIGNFGQLPYNNLSQIAGLIPGYSGPATSSVSPADIGGYFNNQYQSQLGQYNARQQGNNQFTSGLMGLGGTLGGAWLMSDARVKRDIRLVGDWNGTPVYSYRYAFEKTRRLGVLAQEAPSSSVRDFGGLLMVDYRSL